MKLRDLQVGQSFKFAGSTLVYTYRGDGWYGGFGGNDGGPWHSDTNPEVTPV